MSNTEINIDRCRLVTLERHHDPAGTIAVAQNDDQIPFAIKRLFYITDIPSDTSRGGHSHLKCEQMIIALSGSFDVTVTDGRNTQRYTLNRPYRGLYVPAGIWVSLNEFTGGCVCLTLCSELFDEADYIREFDTFLKIANP